MRANRTNVTYTVAPKPQRFEIVKGVLCIRGSIVASDAAIDPKTGKPIPQRFANLSVAQNGKSGHIIDSRKLSDGTVVIEYQTGTRGRSAKVVADATLTSVLASLPKRKTAPAPKTETAS